MKSLALASLMVLGITACQSDDTSKTSATPKVGSEDAQKNVFSCKSAASGKNKYQFKIEVSDSQLAIYQSSTNARYAPIVKEIEMAPIGSDIPAEEPKFACVRESKNEAQYREEIRVYEDSVVVLQSSTIARYAPLKYDVKSEENASQGSEPAIKEDVLFSCEKAPVDASGYRYSVQITENELTVLQSSTNGRYAPIHKIIERAPIVSDLPEGLSKFACVYQPESNPNGYSAQIEVYKDSVLILQSSNNARYAPLRFNVLGDKN